jgi:hypothetical protein
MARDTGLAEVRALTPDRLARLHQRLREHGIGGVIEAIGRVGRSRFCHGSGDRGWFADFDFFIQPGSMNRALEGRYDDRLGGRQTGSEKLRQLGAWAADMRAERRRREALEVAA